MTNTDEEPHKKSSAASSSAARRSNPSSSASRSPSSSASTRKVTSSSSSTTPPPVVPTTTTQQASFSNAIPLSDFGNNNNHNHQYQQSQLPIPGTTGGGGLQQQQQQQQQSLLSNNINNNHPHNTQLRHLIMSKEKELHDINEYRMQTLESMLRDREKVINELKDKMSKMKDDFQYNLKLIEDRDQELDRYDEIFGTLKAKIREKDMEISNLRITSSNLEATVNQSHVKVNDLDHVHQTRLKEIKNEMEGLKWSHDEEMRRKREEIENMRRDLNRLNRIHEDEIESQRNEQQMTYDQVLQQRDTEAKRKYADFQRHIQELENEISLQKRTLDRYKNSDRIVEEQDRKINTLLGDIHQIKSTNATLQHDHEIKVNELLESLHAVERAFVTQKTTMEEEKLRYELGNEEWQRSTVMALESQYEQVEGKLIIADERNNHLENEYREMKQRYEERLATSEREVLTLRTELESIIEEKDNNIKTLTDTNKGLESEIKSLNDRCDRMETLYKDKEVESQRTKESLKSSRTMWEEANTKNIEMTEKITLLRKEIEEREQELQNQLKTLEVSYEEKCTTIQASCEERISIYQENLNTLKEEKTKQESKLNEIQTELEVLQGEKIMLDKKITELETDMVKKDEKIKNLDEEMMTITKGQQEELKRVAELEGDLAILEKSVRSENNRMGQYMMEGETAESHQYDNDQQSRKIESQASPLFSGDYGDASPLPSVSTEMFGENDEQKVDEHIQHLQSKTSSYHSNISPPVASYHYDERVKQANKTNQSNNTRDLELHQQKEVIYQENENRRLRNVISIMREEMEEMRHSRATVSDMYHHNHQQQVQPRPPLAPPKQKESKSLAKIKALEDKLNNTVSSMNGLLQERDKLYEVSNELKSQLNKQKTQTQREDLDTMYNLKLSAIERSLHGLSMENKVLKKQLRNTGKVMESDFFMIEEPDISEDEIRKATRNLREKRRKKTSYSGRLKERKDAVDSEEYVLLTDDSDEIELSREQYYDLLRGKSPKKVLKSPHKSSRSSPHRSKSASKERWADKRKPLTVREKLEQTKSALMLAGNKASIGKSSTESSIPSKQSDKATISQRKSLNRVKEKQEKKTRLQIMAERRKVRNYNNTE